MILNLLIISTFQRQCSYTIVSQIGMFKLDRELSSDETLCINITNYPFYISFYDLSSDLEYNEYYSMSTDRIIPEDYFFNGSELLQLGFRSFELPYSSITFTARSDSSHISLTYLSMPGLCTTGIYFCRSHSDKLIFDKNGDDFFRIKNYDDKCIIFIPPTQTIVKFSQESKDKHDQVYLYKNFTNYDGFSGSFETKDYAYDENETNMVRLLMNSDVTPEKITITFDPLALYKPLSSSYFIPRHKEPKCEVIDRWYSEELIITLIVCCVFFFVLIVIILICRFKHGCKKKERALLIRDIN